MKYYVYMKFDIDYETSEVGFLCDRVTVNENEIKCSGIHLYKQDAEYMTFDAKAIEKLTITGKPESSL